MAQTAQMTQMTTHPETDEILFERRGGLAIATLNRPQALNALNLPMIRAYAPRLAAWARDPSVAAVLIRGAGGRAFCAGGDVRAVWAAGKAARAGTGDGALTRDFFAEEYALNSQIHHFSKPYIALIDGIVMGGGVGLSVHGSHRVATERTQLAMPETAIGFIPDVGTTYVLARCPGETGAWLALTGARLGGADALAAGLATNFAAAADLDALTGRLAAIDWAAGPAARLVADVLAGFAADPGPAPLAGLRPLIDHAFAFDRVEDICAALDASNDPWAAETRATLAAMSPTSLKLALAALRRARALDFEAAIETEFRLSQVCMKGHDFYEGIRAVLVDKDRRPSWRPAMLDEVCDADIGRCFAPA